MSDTTTGTPPLYGTVVHTFGPNVTLTMPGMPPIPYWSDVARDAS